MVIKNVKLKNLNGDYLYPYTENIPKDTFPVDGSTNLITSGAIYTAINTLKINELSLYQSVAEIPSTDIELQDTITIYQKTISENTAFSFNLECLSKMEKVITFELFLTLITDNLSLSFLESISWINNVIPSTETAQKYLFAFRTFNAGITWIGNLQGVFA